MILVASFWPAIADAQTMSTGNERSKAYKKMASACVADTARFCPNVGRSSVARRELYLCLKVYHADLAVPCRKAVNAVSPMPPA